MEISKIRNFCIIAHIDHGKSTLADRMLEMTGTITKLDHAQVLDKMDLEQERGITIKLAPARMNYKGYQFNLIDTPGHVDFQYEVSRSLAAVEGAILLVDASQGIQAQTLSNLYMALDQGLEIIPVLNKVDLPSADPERFAREIEKLIGVPASQVIPISAKTGFNVDKVLDAVIEKIMDPATFREFHPERNGNSGATRALIYDSTYDKYKGVVTYVKVVEGVLKAGDTVKFVHSQTSLQINEVGFFSPDYTKSASLGEGQIGYIITGQKSVTETKIGDTIVIAKKDDDIKRFEIPGFKTVVPYVFAGVYPIESDEYEKLKDAIQKLSLNDSAIVYEYENSKALGFGFRCGFLGMLHMDIVKERLHREFDVDTIFTVPNAVYLVKSKQQSIEKIKSGQNVEEIVAAGLEKYVDDIEKWLLIKSGGDMIDNGMVEDVLEPIALVEIVGNEEFSGNIMGLCSEYRGIMKNMEYIDEKRVMWRYEMPLGEMIVDFYDKLKGLTKGYATMNYEFLEYRSGDLVRLDIFINGEKIEAFSMVVHVDKAYHVGKNICEKLKELIPKHMFAIPIQAGIGNKIIARETISAMKKDVLAKCYGGDVSRKRKLLEKQKEGKKKMKAMGKVSVPSDIFIKMNTRSD